MRIFTKTKNPDIAAPIDSTHLEERTQSYGRQILARLPHRPSFLSTEKWSEKLMDWATQDPGFKVQMFRFVDVYPTLTSPGMIYDVLDDYLQQPGVTIPRGLGFGMAAGSLAKKAMAKTISSQIRGVANRFIAGVDAASSTDRLEDLWKNNLCFSVDLLGETCLSDIEADHYRRQYLDLVTHLSDESATWEPNNRLESDHLGAIPRCNVSIKISALCARIKPADMDGSIERLYESIAPILQEASKKNVFINFDMEQFHLKDLTIALFQKCCENIDFEAGIALQSYLRSARSDVHELVEWSKRVGRQVTVRLIKGAYWDYETIHAERMGWPVPVWSRKADTDLCYEDLLASLIRQLPRSPSESGLKLALGSHNVRSIARAHALLEQYELPKNAIEYQFLVGMADHLKKSLSENGHRVRSYVPVGEMIPGIAYLVRRLLENTSNESWLRFSSQSDDAAELLAAPPPKDGGQTSFIREDAAIRHQLSATIPEVANGVPFSNEPFRDFSCREQREEFAREITRLKIPQPPEIILREKDTEAAISRACASAKKWSATPMKRRSETLLRAAASMRQKRDQLAGAVIRESGKNWHEADADVCEAIDFCEFYARQAYNLFASERLGRFTGELNLYRHLPIGVAAIISPWNFPLAICAGMTAAALVTGNSTLLKPSTQTPGIARLLCEELWAAGIPSDVLQLVPGPGKTVGKYLVEHPSVGIVGFTGSREVGLGILEAAGKLVPGQANVKRVVCEMGGKNAIIVDATADLDEAVAGIRASAFGYSGQKCSACSRVIVVGDESTVLRRLIHATQALTIGDPMAPGTDIGPVIDEHAAAKINEYIAIAKKENHLELAMQAPQGLADEIDKPFIGPHIFSSVAPTDTIAQEEIFGPVLAVMKADSFQEAIKLANDSPYKLTGAVYSRTPKNLNHARTHFRVGNLYLNQGSTGALVGRQPFGGFGHSGTGTKAGGADYLRHFVFSTVCTENTQCDAVSRRNYLRDLRRLHSQRRLQELLRVRRPHVPIGTPKSRPHVI